MLKRLRIAAIEGNLFSSESIDSNVNLIVMLANQSILKEISPEYSLGGLMLKLKLQYFGHLM